MFLYYFFQNQINPLLQAGLVRIAAIPNTGYTITFANRQLVAPVLNYIQNQGLSSATLFHHDARVGLNSNFVPFSDDINAANTGWSKGSNLTANGQVGTSPLSGAKAWSFSFVGGGNAFIQGDVTTGRFAVLPDTTYTVSADVRLASGVFAGGSRSLYLRCQDSGGAVTAARGGAEIVPTSDWQRFSVTVTTGALDAFAGFLFPFDCSAGSTLEYAAPQIEIGSVATTYQARLNDTAPLLNNLVNNPLGDGTLVNGVASTMAIIDATAGRVLNFNNTLSQGVQTGLISNITDFTIVHWIRVPSLLGARVTYSKGNTRLVFQTDGVIRLSNSGQVTSTAGQIVANTWIGVTVSCSAAGTTVIYKNAVSVGIGTLDRSIDNSNPVVISQTSGASFLGQIGEATLFNTVLTAGQVLDIYNIQKARYGL